ncbi:serine/threonine protein kinase [Haliangium ochraceum DSM 14365]|uniref:Serine/threonine protein kinase n=1 Tax=Haliangium ochraceum (strain DSM 14365 / JCM 11303 / SMP-2) TaxID=502025 RepID=D0LLA2_HALO1|nr:serine/threonine protein kinase [Haliangium ochraceum DSM 14365]
MTEPSQKYQVLRRIGEGGMAEVFLAEMRCQPGYNKHVALKRVLPRLAGNDRFLRMFLDEARLGLLLNHANIVHVFDVGRAGEAYFIVMEYVNGVNLKELLKRQGAHATLLPVEMSAFIAVEICRALHYAHQLCDRAGNPLRVVHHDVNPANVLLSVNGEIKVVDFGLSEAAVHVEKTDPDIVRGKFGYLSPEAAYGMGADARSDVYATGIVLFEMLTGTRLFEGKSDQEAIQMARAAKVPSPRERNPDIPPALEEVLYRSLARDPKERYQSSRAFARALTEALYVDLGRPINAFTIGSLVEVVRDELRGERSERAALIELMIEEELVQIESLDFGPHSPGNPLVDPRRWFK